MTITNQPAGPRIRITFGDDGSKKYNSDLDFKETEDLIILLQYHLEKAKGNIPNE